ncbi:MAG: hypothetical protein KDJ65_19480 [Anaerolineae bacterium]|nr:hypothetical protein [Anaerolineae bacterium]
MNGKDNAPQPAPDFTLDEVDELVGSMDGIITILTTWQATSPYRLAKLNRAANDFAMQILEIAQENEAVLEAEAVARAAFGGGRKG